MVLDAWYQSVRTDPYVFAKIGLFPIGSCFGGHSAVVKSHPVAKLPRTTFSLKHSHSQVLHVDRGKVMVSHLYVLRTSSGPWRKLLWETNISDSGHVRMDHLTTCPSFRYMAMSGRTQCQSAPGFSMYRGLSILVHVAMKVALVGSPKTAAPVCVLTRRLGGGDCFYKGYVQPDKTDAHITAWQCI